ncbi:MAG: cytochrome c [Rhodospirillaceae bacterium]|nr:cytochrome c [Rhodospirillaceae bacterium]
MSMFKRAATVLIAAGFCSRAFGATETPMLGKPISPADLAPWDLSIGPDGAGLPSGKGSAKEGKQVFADKCSYCHGSEGQGQPADRLVGGQGTLTSDAPVKTVGSYWPYATTLFDFVRRAMPLNEPQTLTSDEVYAVSAYILAANGIIKNSEVMNAKTLPKVKMPNRGNFFIVYPGNLK